MSHPAKVFARVFDYTSTPDMADGTMRFTVEYKRITGDRQAGKVQFLVEDITNDTAVRDSLREQLAAHLSTKYAPEQFKPRDIVGYSV